MPIVRADATPAPRGTAAERTRPSLATCPTERFQTPASKTAATVAVLPAENQHQRDRRPRHPIRNAFLLQPARKRNVITEHPDTCRDQKRCACTRPICCVEHPTSGRSEHERRDLVHCHVRHQPQRETSSNKAKTPIKHLMQRRAFDRLRSFLRNAAPHTFRERRSVVRHRQRNEISSRIGGPGDATQAPAGPLLVDNKATKRRPFFNAKP